MRLIEGGARHYFADPQAHMTDNKIRGVKQVPVSRFTSIQQTVLTIPVTIGPQLFHQNGFTPRGVSDHE